MATESNLVKLLTAATIAYGCLTMIGEAAILGSEKKIPEISTISAAYFRQHNHLVPYETTAKVVFTVSLPQFTVTNPGNCDESNVVCGIRKTTWDIKTKFDRYIGQFTSAKSRKKRQVSIIVAGAAGYLLNTIFSKFSKRMFGSDSEASTAINEFREVLVKSSKEHLFFTQSITTLADTFKELEGKYWFLDNEVDKRTKALAFQGQVQAGTSDVRHGIERCTNQHLPIEFVQPDDLKAMLRKVETALKDRGYRLSIPESSVNEYYKVSLADCMVSKTTARILVSIPLEKLEWRVFDAVPVGFSFHNQTCIIRDTGKMIAVSRERVEVIDSQMSLYCDTIRDHMCFIPPFSHPTGTCLQKIYARSSLDELASSCEMKCNEDSSVLITYVDHSKVVVTNGKALKVSCNDRNVRYALHPIGATEITVKCGCQYEVNDEKVDLNAMCEIGEFLDSDIKTVVPHYWQAPLNVSSQHGINNTDFKKWSHMLPKIQRQLKDMQEDTIRMELLPPKTEGWHYRDIWLVGLSSGYVIIFATMFVFCVCMCKRKPHVTRENSHA